MGNSKKHTSYSKLQREQTVHLEVPKKSLGYFLALSFRSTLFHLPLP